MHGGDEPHVLDCRVEPVLRLHDVGDADLDLAAAHHGNDDVVAGRGLDQHVHAGLLLQHLGDRGRVVWLSEPGGRVAKP